MREKAKTLLPYAKYVLLLLAGVFIAAGVLRAEPAEVLQKAVNICLECIGVG